jgi:hypothetical protein
MTFSSTKQIQPQINRAALSRPGLRFERVKGGTPTCQTLNVTIFDRSVAYAGEHQFPAAYRGEL